MWAAMADRDGQIPELSAQDVRDVYAFLYSIRYFDPPGRHERGKDFFESMKCQRCHAIVGGADVSGIGPPVAAWPSMTDPIAFLEAMWNHGEVMDQETSAMGYPWPKMTPWDIADLAAYVENVPVTAARPARLRLGPPEAGMKVFEDLACSSCHTLTGESPDKISLIERVRERRTLTALAASMWNHRPVMREWSEETGIPLRRIEPGQMANLLSFLFEEGVLEARGDGERGERLFRTKGCYSCHTNGAAALPAADTSGSEIVSAMWRHGPKMRAEVIRQGGEWPQLSEQDLADLITWLAGR
jgi:cytochrome c2